MVVSQKGYKCIVGTPPLWELCFPSTVQVSVSDLYRSETRTIEMCSQLRNSNDNHTRLLIVSGDFTYVLQWPRTSVISRNACFLHSIYGGEVSSSCTSRDDKQLRVNRLCHTCGMSDCILLVKRGRVQGIEYTCHKSITLLTIQHVDQSWE